MNLNQLPSNNLSSAIQDFRDARRLASLKAVFARLRGKHPGLMSFEQVRHQLRASGAHQRGLQDIPLDAIVGSVGRYDDFTREFLPRFNEGEGRWARVKLAVEQPRGLPPIDVYKIGDAYFVLDGNHRVSVARQQEASHIQAYVTEIKTRVPLSPEDQPDDLIIKARYVDFLEDTRIDEFFPGIDLSVTVPGRYRQLREHIAIHQYQMGIQLKRDISFFEAVKGWVKDIYFPSVNIIRNRGILRDFPGRTETDMYLFLINRQAELTDHLGWDLRPEEAALDLVGQFSPRLPHVFQRIVTRLRSWFRPAIIDPGPSPGQWRSDNVKPRTADRMFSSILVPISGEAHSWQAFDQAALVAQREGGQLRGLHIALDDQPPDAATELALHQQFEDRCSQVGIDGQLVIESGPVAKSIIQRAGWNDLVVIRLSHPPEDRPLSRLRSGFHSLLQSSPRPVLAVPQLSPLQHALIAYDGSPKAHEALFLAAYLARSWQLSLVVLTIRESRLASGDVLARAREYLASRQVEAAFVEKDAPVGPAILETAQQHQRDLIIMGGYGRSPVVELVLGSAVDHVLRQSPMPILICR